MALKVATGEDKDETDAVKLIRGVPFLDLPFTRDLPERRARTAGANRLDALARPEHRNGAELSRRLQAPTAGRKSGK